MIDQKITPQSESDWFYFDKLTYRRYRNKMIWKNIDYLEPYGICLNDAFKGTSEEIENEIIYTLEELEKRYPLKTPFEKEE